jgi:hypothetical protein
MKITSWIVYMVNVIGVAFMIWNYAFKKLLEMVNSWHGNVSIRLVQDSPMLEKRRKSLDLRSFTPNLLTFFITSRLNWKKLISQLCYKVSRQKIQGMPSNFSKRCIFSDWFYRNYSFECQKKIQEMHWFSFQVTILVHIIYHHNVDYSLEDLESKTITK